MFFGVTVNLFCPHNKRSCFVGLFWQSYFVLLWQIFCHVSTCIDVQKTRLILDNNEALYYCRVYCRYESIERRKPSSSSHNEVFVQSTGSNKATVSQVCTSMISLSVGEVCWNRSLGFLEIAGKNTVPFIGHRHCMFKEWHCDCFIATGPLSAWNIANFMPSSFCGIYFNMFEGDIFNGKSFLTSSLQDILCEKFPLKVKMFNEMLWCDKNLMSIDWGFFCFAYLDLQWKTIFCLIFGSLE